MPITTITVPSFNQHIVSLAWKQLWLFALPGCERARLREGMISALKIPPCELSIEVMSNQFFLLNSFLINRFGPDAYLHAYLADGFLLTKGGSIHMPFTRCEWTICSVDPAITSDSFRAFATLPEDSVCLSETELIVMVGDMEGI